MSYVALKILPRLKIQGQCLLHVGDVLVEFRGSSYLTFSSWWYRRCYCGNFCAIRNSVGIGTKKCFQAKKDGTSVKEYLFSTTSSKVIIKVIHRGRVEGTGGRVLIIKSSHKVRSTVRTKACLLTGSTWSILFWEEKEIVMWDLTFQTPSSKNAFWLHSAACEF